MAADSVSGDMDEKVALVPAHGRRFHGWDHNHTHMAEVNHRMSDCVSVGV